MLFRSVSQSRYVLATIVTGEELHHVRANTALVLHVHAHLHGHVLRHCLQHLHELCYCYWMSHHNDLLVCMTPLSFRLDFRSTRAKVSSSLSSCEILISSLTPLLGDSLRALKRCSICLLRIIINLLLYCSTVCVILNMK